MSRTGRSVQLPSSHNTNLFIEAEFVGSIVIYSYTGSIVKGREDVLLCLVFLDSTYVVTFTCTKIVDNTMSAIGRGKESFVNLPKNAQSLPSLQVAILFESFLLCSTVLHI